MVSAVQGDASSSANVNFFCITDICHTSLESGKFVDSEEVSYFTRPVYFEEAVLQSIEDGINRPVTEHLLSEFLRAVRRYAAESAAMKYLNRAEHSRFQLETKLKKKDS